ncbi:hypothetical protein LVJ94_10565 [Pendulispora rubella]|uniref:Uncharacterized protein n=1 Tax=Pendulispora rubella TaxID=2741070 RepID=A0ABZ2L9R2_9BACT
MLALRSASLVASVAFGLMGCAAQGVGQPHTGASVASYDASTLYQPSPNYRPLAVTVTREVGTRTAHCTAAEQGSVGMSPNARLCP